MKFLDMVDRAGTAKAEKREQHPSEAMLRREQKLRDKAHKVNALKAARLAASQAGGKPVAVVIDVVRHRGFWRIFHRNTYSPSHANQAAAISAGKDLARKKREKGHLVELRLVRADGQVVPQSIEDEQDG